MYGKVKRVLVVVKASLFATMPSRSNTMHVHLALSTQSYVSLDTLGYAFAFLLDIDSHFSDMN